MENFLYRRRNPAGFSPHFSRIFSAFRSRAGSRAISHIRYANFAFLLLAWRKEKKGNACKSLLLSSLGLTTLFFLGAIPTNGNDDIASLTWKGIFHQDNHLYAVSLFFSLFLLLGLLGLGLTMSLYRFLDKQKQARSVSE